MKTQLDSTAGMVILPIALWPKHVRKCQLRHHLIIRVPRKPFLQNVEMPVPYERILEKWGWVGVKYKGAGIGGGSMTEILHKCYKSQQLCHIRFALVGPFCITHCCIPASYMAATKVIRLEIQ